MIKSTISNLEKGLENTTENIQLSEIEYLDYDKETTPTGNLMYPIIHKQRAYSYENEVRLIHEVSLIGWEHDWTKEEIEEGVFIKADLNILIDEIVISPFAPNWFHKLVEDLSSRYDLDKPIKKSKLTFSGI